MALARARRGQRGFNYWPGFVDALSTMLLVIIFLLSVFMLAQFFLSREVTGKDTALDKLNQQIEQLTSLLALERADKADRRPISPSLSATLDTTQAEKARLQGLVDADNASAGAVGGQAAAANRRSSMPKSRSRRARWRKSIFSTSRSPRCAASSPRSRMPSRHRKTATRKARRKIADLGSRLNVALAQKVQELSRYRSDFFGRLREILGDRPGIRVVGDRFVFDSEVLFDTRPGRAQRSGPAPSSTSSPPPWSTLEREIPPEIRWVLQVNGHTDKRPICRRPVQVELGTLRRARHRGRAISDRQGRPIRSISPPPASANSSRSTPATATRRWPATAASS